MDMGFITTRVHGLLDIISASALLNTKSFLRSDINTPESLVPTVIGGVISANSFFTDFEPGIVHKIPVRIHMTIDIISGVVLALSPFGLGFYRKTWKFHFCCGLLLILTAVFSQSDRDKYGFEPVVVTT
jgi:hypothetical protein